MSYVTSWKERATASTNRKIFSATIIIASLSFSAKLIMIVKEMAVAASYGTSDVLDAFLLAYLMPMFATNVIGGSFNAALIPTYIRVRQNEGTIEAQRLLSNVLVLTLGLFLLATVVMVLAAPYYLPLLASGFNYQKLNLTCDLLYVLSPLIILSGINTIWGAVLNAGERFALVAVTPAITPALIVLFLWLGGKTWGITALTTGTVCGVTLETVIIGFALSRNGTYLWPAWHGMNGHVKKVVYQFLPMILGAFLLGSTAPINQGMAAMLGPGSVSAFNYGTKLIAFPIGLATTALGTAVIPYFSMMVINRDWAGITDTLNKYLRMVFIITIPITILLVAISEPLAAIIFQRGSFTANDTHLVASIQALYTLQIPFYIASILVVRLISSFSANKVLMWGALISLVANIAMNIIFIKWLGVSGIALSTSLVYIMSFYYLKYMLSKLLKHNQVHYEQR